MKSDKYDVILMRDHSSVKRFRLNGLWIKLFVLFFVILLAASIAGGYYSFVFLGEKREMAHLYEGKAESLLKVERELKRLQNVQEMYESYREDELKTLLAGQLQHNQEKMSHYQAVDLRAILDPVDMNIVKVSNVQARFVNNKMQVRLEVNNMAGNGKVSGRVFLHLISNCGVMRDISIDDSDLNYVIARFRTMEAAFELPGDMDEESIFALRIRAVDDHGNTVYSKVFPLSSILI